MKWQSKYYSSSHKAAPIFHDFKNKKKMKFSYNGPYRFRENAVLNVDGRMDDGGMARLETLRYGHTLSSPLSLWLVLAINAIITDDVSLYIWKCLFRNKNTCN